MLVDYGSSTSFVNNSPVTFLEGVEPLPKTYKVRATDGRELSYSSMIPNVARVLKDMNSPPI